MGKKWRIFQLETSSPPKNMAIDEALFRAKINNPDLPNSLRFYQWSPSAVSCGKHQELDNEINVEEALKREIIPIRRITGGGAVFHASKGEITYSLVVDIDNFNEKDSESIGLLLLKGLQQGFQNLGLDTTYDKIHCPSLFIEGKKISGNAQARHKNVLLQHGTILIDYNPELMYTVLKARQDKPRKRMMESVYAYVTTLKLSLGKIPSNKEISIAIAVGFQRTFANFEWIKGYFSSEELKLIDHYKKRYSSNKWLLNRKF